MPEYSSAADIQAAFYMYHYGQGSIPTSPDSSLQNGSLAKYLYQIQSDIDSGSMKPFDLTTGENLDLKTANGFYFQASNANARSSGSSNYPVYVGQAYAGALIVFSKNGHVFQQYIMSGDTTGAGPVNVMFWRSKIVGANFTPWKQISDTSHTHSISDISNLQISIDSKAPLLSTFVTTILTSGEYTIQQSDSGKVIDIAPVSSGVAKVIIPADSGNLLFPIGTTINIYQSATGTVSVQPASGVVLNYSPGNELRTRYSMATIIKRDSSVWVLAGDLAETFQ